MFRALERDRRPEPASHNTHVPCVVCKVLQTTGLLDFSAHSLQQAVVQSGTSQRTRSSCLSAGSTAEQPGVAHVACALVALVHSPTKAPHFLPSMMTGQRERIFFVSGLRMTWRRSLFLPCGGHSGHAFSSPPSVPHSGQVGLHAGHSFPKTIFSHPMHRKKPRRNTDRHRPQSRCPHTTTSSSSLRSTFAYSVSSLWHTLHSSFSGKSKSSRGTHEYASVHWGQMFCTNFESFLSSRCSGHTVCPHGVPSARRQITIPSVLSHDPSSPSSRSFAPSSRNRQQRGFASSVISSCGIPACKRNAA